LTTFALSPVVIFEFELVELRLRVAMRECSGKAASRASDPMRQSAASSGR
jgi:hypothetical protein